MAFLSFLILESFKKNPHPPLWHIVNGYCITKLFKEFFLHFRLCPLCASWPTCAQNFTLDWMNVLHVFERFNFFKF
jgi:hypothetical protein